MARLLNRRSKVLFKTWGVALGALCVVGAVAACGDDDTTPVTPKPDASTTPDTGADSPSAAPSVKGTVNYAGAARGNVNLALFKQLGGLPDYNTRVPAASATTFPVSFEFKDVKEGTYKLTAYIDVGGDSPTGPGAGDPRTGPPQDVVVTATGASGVTVTILDLPPAEAGADADPDASDAGTD